MKKYAFFFVLAAIMLAVGCEKESNTDVVENSNEELITYSFTATSADDNADDSDDEALRSTFDNYGAFSWAVGDKIAIYNSASSPAAYVNFEVTSVDGSGNATIEASAPSGAVWTNAIYPAARATGAGNGVDYAVSSVAGPILVSQVNNGQTLAFKYLGSVVNLIVTGVPDTPATLTFTANANVFGSRTFSWVDGAPVLGGSGSAASITVPFNASGITTIPVPKEDYDGFTITVDNAAGRHLFKKTTSNSFPLATGNKILLRMGTLAYAAPEIYYMRTSDTRGGNFWSCDIPLLKTGADAHYALANVDKTATYVIFDEYNKVDPGTAVPNYAVLKSGNVLDLTYSANTFSLVGDINSWTLENNSSYAFNKIGDWNYLLNKSGLHNKAFKFNPWGNTTAGNWGPVWGSSGAAWFNDRVKKVTIGEGTSYGNCGLFLDNTTVNIFLNTADAKAYYREASDKNNPISALVAFTYTPSTNELSTSTEDEWGVVAPFNDPSYPTTEYLFVTNLDNWALTHTMSYNNWCWTYTFDVATAGTYYFDIARSGWGYKVAQSSTWQTVDVAAKGYGRLSYWDQDADATVNLSKGTYKVFLNPTYNYEHSLNIQFVKQ